MSIDMQFCPYTPTLIDLIPIWSLLSTVDDDDATVGRRKEESNKRKSGYGLKDKAPPTKMKFSLGSKPKAAPLKISLGKPQVGDIFIKHIWA